MSSLAINAALGALALSWIKRTVLWVAFLCLCLGMCLNSILENSLIDVRGLRGFAWIFGVSVFGILYRRRDLSWFVKRNAFHACHQSCVEHSVSSPWLHEKKEDARLAYNCEMNGKHTETNVDTKCVLGCHHPGSRYGCANYTQFFKASSIQLCSKDGRLQLMF